jgi:hypothetical protein
MDFRGDCVGFQGYAQLTGYLCFMGSADSIAKSVPIANDDFAVRRETVATMKPGSIDATLLLRRALAEFIGTALLLIVVIGSGIAAQSLSSGDVGLELSSSHDSHQR